MEAFQLRVTIFGGPNNKDYSSLGSTLGFPYFGKESQAPDVICLLGSLFPSREVGPKPDERAGKIQPLRQSSFARP